MKITVDTVSFAAHHKAKCPEGHFLDTYNRADAGRSAGYYRLTWCLYDSPTLGLSKYSAAGQYRYC